MYLCVSGVLSERQLHFSLFHWEKWAQSWQAQPHEGVKYNMMNLKFCGTFLSNMKSIRAPLDLVALAICGRFFGPILHFPPREGIHLRTVIGYSQLLSSICWCVQSHILVSIGHYNHSCHQDSNIIYLAWHPHLLKILSYSHTSNNLWLPKQRPLVSRMPNLKALDSHAT